MNRMFLILSLLCLQPLQASEVRENYNGARSLAMGGAGIAVVNDETALLMNPGGLGKLRDNFGTIFDPELEGGHNLNEMYNTKAFTQPFDLEEVKATTMETREKYFHQKFQMFPSFVAKNFGIGFQLRKLMDAQMNAAGTTMSTYFQDDLAMYMGFNLRFFDGKVKIGAVGKAISRIEINADLDATQTLDRNTLASEGVGIGSDVGVILTAPVVLLPTLSAVIRDMGGTSFDAGSGLRMQSTTRPQSVEQDMDVAIAFFPIHSSNKRSSITFQYDKIKEASQATDKSRYYHAGYEFNYGDVLFLRTGMNQKYWTAGIEIASERTQIQFTAYGEDIGTDGDSKEDRRYVFKFSFRY